MGQYWKPVNLDKREFLNPHKLSCGLKLGEQLGSPGIGTALVILTASMPQVRGGGDLSLNTDVAKRTIGRWAGDRIALIGDYAERNDLPPQHEADVIYHLCSDHANRQSQINHWRKCEWSDDPTVTAKYADKADRLEAGSPYTDITYDVCAVIEAELNGKFDGVGWREFVESTVESTESTIRL